MKVKNKYWILVDLYDGRVTRMLKHARFAKLAPLYDAQNETPDWVAAFEESAKALPRKMKKRVRLHGEGWMRPEQFSRYFKEV